MITRHSQLHQGLFNWISEKKTLQNLEKLFEQLKRFQTLAMIYECFLQFEPIFWIENIKRVQEVID